MVNGTALVHSHHMRRNCLKWNPHSKERLHESETLLLSKVKVPYETSFVPIGDCVGDNDEIWTLSANTQSQNVPIVLLHGFAAAIAFWMKNLDAFAENNPVYAIDLLGFGKSSRPDFSADAEEVEKQFCESIERWRQVMQIDKMILLGHSFGGFLSTSYALKYPEHIEHLILADPWGFVGKPDLSGRPLWQRTILKSAGKIAPLAIVRVAGPFGEWLIHKMRKDIMRKYEDVVEDGRVVATYIHQCNTANPSGEFAFQKLLEGGPWAKFPIGERMRDEIASNIPVTFLYGAQSWMNNTFGIVIKESRPNSYTHIEYISNAGHHVYADNVMEFNQYVINACCVLKSRKK